MDVPRLQDAHPDSAFMSVLVNEKCYCGSDAVCFRHIKSLMKTTHESPPPKLGLFVGLVLKCFTKAKSVPLE